MYCESKKNPNELDLAIPFFNYYYALAVTVITSVIFVIKIVHGGGVHVKIKTLDINVRVFHTSLLFDGVGGGGKAEVDWHLIWYHLLLFVCTIYLIVDQNVLFLDI